jgi:hypothetical protein
VILNQPIVLVQPCSPAGVCRQCGEKYFKPEVLKRMGSLYHGIFERNEKPYRPFPFRQYRFDPAGKSCR